MTSNGHSAEAAVRAAVTGNTGGQRGYRAYPPHKWGVDFLRLSDNATSPANVAFSDIRDIPIQSCLIVYTKNVI